jgi:hypothetical protein
VDVQDLHNDAERRLWAAFPQGEPVDLGEGDPTEDDFDPQSWTDERVVRAEVITRLLLGAVDAERGYVTRMVLGGARITGPLDLNGGEVNYELLLSRCWFDTALDFSDARTRGIWITYSHLPGLTAVQLEANGRLSLRGSLVTDEIMLIGAHVKGNLNLGGASLRSEGGRALVADQLTIDGSMFCGEGFTATGEVRLLDARISGTLNLGGAILDNEDGRALAADRMTVLGSMFLRDGFRATGGVRLLGAHIGSNLEFDGATLVNSSGGALDTDNLTVKGDMFMRDGFTATGAVRLTGAHIGGSLDLDGATLMNGDGTALEAQDLTVEGSVFMRDGFHATGQVRLYGADVHGSLDIDQAELSNATGLALDCEAMQANRMVLDASVAGVVDLTRAKVDRLYLSSPAVPPPMRLDGLVYTELAGRAVSSARQRIVWLRRDPDGYHPQPYEQLASYYRSIGHERDARVVLLKKRRAFRRHQVRSWPAPLRVLLAPLWRGPSLMLDALSGYGYVPQRAFCWLIAAMAAGWWALRGAPLPTLSNDSDANTLLYVVDALVPTSPFGLENKATLHGAELAWSLGLQVLGWALSIAILPAISRALGRGGPLS